MPSQRDVQFYNEMMMTLYISLFADAPVNPQCTLGIFKQDKNSMDFLKLIIANLNKKILLTKYTWALNLFLILGTYTDMTHAKNLSFNAV